MTANNAPNETGSAASDRTIEITTDEDWKSRVKAENAAIDQQFHPSGADPAKSDPAKSDRAKSPPGDPMSEAKRSECEAPSKPPETAPPESHERRSLPPLPEASLAALLGLLSNQAMVAMGLIRNPATGKAEKELPVARYFIDLIDVLEQKTKGNLDRDEAAALDETLHTLRMAYVHRSKDMA